MRIPVLDVPVKNSVTQFLTLQSRRGMRIFFTLRLVPTVATLIGLAFPDGPGHGPN